MNKPASDLRFQKQRRIEKRERFKNCEVSHPTKKNFLKENMQKKNWLISLHDSNIQLSKKSNLNLAFPHLEDENMQFCI